MKSQARNSTNPDSVCTRGLTLSHAHTLQLTSQLWYKMVIDCTLFSICESFSCLVERTLIIASWRRVHIVLINKQKCTVLPPIVYFSCIQTLSINNAGSTRDCDWNVNESRFSPVFLCWFVVFQAVISEANMGHDSARCYLCTPAPSASVWAAMNFTRPHLCCFFVFFKRTARRRGAVCRSRSCPYLSTSSSYVGCFKNADRRELLCLQPLWCGMRRLCVWTLSVSAYWRESGWLARHCASHSRALISF